MFRYTSVACLFRVDVYYEIIMKQNTENGIAVFVRKYLK